MKEYNESFSEIQLFRHHMEKLTQEHGLDIETIKDAELFSATSQTLNHMLGRNDVVCDGIVIPYNDGFSRVRLDKPLILRNNKEAKYLSPTNSENRLYIPNSVRPILKDPFTTLFITEGELKTLKLIQEGFPCIGIPGVWGFSREKKLLPDFNEINLKGRKLIVILDSDARKKIYANAE